MAEPPTEPHVVTLNPQGCAVVRETVPVNDLPAFFARAFHLTAASISRQGRQVTGPPLGIYFGMPSDTVDVAAGFPVNAPIETDGAVVPQELPGGRVVQVLHVGSYDSLAQTYDRLSAWMREQRLPETGIMWESYLNEPQPDDPESTRTLITWTTA
jgi:effector-binding domain-containing protein